MHFLVWPKGKNEESVEKRAVSIIEIGWIHAGINKNKKVIRPKQNMQRTTFAYPVNLN
jgi:hypothetical protein